MTEIELKAAQAAASAPAAASTPGAAQSRQTATLADDESFGRALAAARKGRGLSQGDVAAQLRLQLRQVKAIEADDLSALPEGPFVRGFVRNYAKIVDLPAEPLLAMLNARLKPAEPLRADTAASAGPVQMAMREQFSRLAVIGGAVAALLLFAALGWWSVRKDERAAVPTTAAAAASQNAPVDPTESAQTTPSQASPPRTGEAAAASAEAADAPAIAPATAAPETTTTTDAALRFNFRDRSWVEVRQADGTVLMSRNNEAGTTATVEGAPPYTVVVGNASQVDIEYRGKPVDLAGATSRDDVARLRLE
jgi:cytoskeleton protein RodZ